MKKRRKTVLITAALLLCLTVGIGVSSAYFTDYESARGGAVIELGGQTKITENVDDGNKIVSVQNTGRTDMIVRVMIYGDKDHISNISADGWIKGSDGAYYYGKVLKPDESSDTLTVNVRTSSSETDDFEIIVVHEGSRAVYAGNGDPGAEGQSLAVPDGWDADAVAQIQTQ